MTSTALVPVSDLEKMAQAVAASKLFGVTNVEQALALMLVAQAEGLHPATAARDYHIIQGRPTLKADAMLARYLASGGSVQWHDHTDQKVSATFTHPQGGSLTIDWDFARAKAAGLGSKDMWLKYPRQMLRARVISEGIRATNPGISIGMYTPEEAQDMEPAKGARKEKNMGPAIVVPEDQTPAGSGNTAATSSSPVPAGADRTKQLQELAAKTTITVAAILAKAGCKSVEEMSDEDYADACAMLRARVISEGIRATNPGISIGMYTPEEAQDMESAKGARKEKNMGPAIVIPEDQSRQEAQSGPTSSSTQPAGAVRTEELKALAAKTTITVAAILAKAGCKSVEEMSDEDYADACAMLRAWKPKVKA